MLYQLGQSLAADLDLHFAGPPTGGALSVAELDVLDAVAQADQLLEPNIGTLTQDADTVTKNTATFSADGDGQYGAVQVWMIKIKKVADVAFDAGVLNFFAGTKLARSESYRIVKLSTVLHELRTGGTPDHDIKLELGDGAGPEVFTTIAGPFDVDSDTPAAIMNRALANVDTAELIPTGVTLRINPEVSGVTTTGTFEMDVYLHVIPVRA
jgi:hypothetical protein